MLPIVDSLAQKYINKCIIAKFDTTKNSQVPSFFSIRGVPTFYFFKGGKIVDQLVGAIGEQALETKIVSLLSKR